MRKLLMTATAMGALGTLAACGGGTVTGPRQFVTLPENIAMSVPAATVMDEARATKPTSGAFAMSLYEGYMEHAEYEYGDYNQDYKDAMYHANKAIRVARGDIPAPTEFSERIEPADKVSELTDARARLVAALPAGQTTDPASAGKAQTYFDCWMEQQEENFQPRDIAYCRNGFFANLEKIEQNRAEVPELVALSSDVFFDFDKATLKRTYLPELDKIAATMVEDTAAQVLVWGFTDTAGPASYNQGLSERRANAVANYLSGKGVTKDRMVIKGFGETNLAVQTPDNSPNAKNRRVEIRRR